MCSSNNVSMTSLRDPKFLEIHLLYDSPWTKHNVDYRNGSFLSRHGRQARASLFGTTAPNVAGPAACACPILRPPTRNDHGKEDIRLLKDTVLIATLLSSLERAPDRTMTVTRLSYIPQPHEQVSFDYLTILLPPRGVERTVVTVSSMALWQCVRW